MTSVEVVALKVAFVSATLSGFLLAGIEKKKKKKHATHHEKW